MQLREPTAEKHPTNPPVREPQEVGIGRKAPPAPMVAEVGPVPRLTSTRHSTAQVFALFP